MQVLIVQTSFVHSILNRFVFVIILFLMKKNKDSICILTYSCIPISEYVLRLRTWYHLLLQHFKLYLWFCRLNKMSFFFFSDCSLFVNSVEWASSSSSWNCSFSHTHRSTLCSVWIINLNVNAMARVQCGVFVVYSQVNCFHHDLFIFF